MKSKVMVGSGVCIAFAGLFLASAQAAEGGEGKEGNSKTPLGKRLSVDLSDVEVGALPDGLLSARPADKGVCKWEKIIDYGPGDSASKAHECLGVPVPPGFAFNLLLAEDTNLQDLKMVANVKTISGKIDQGGGLIWRVKDVNNYYLARWKGLHRDLQIFSVVERKSILLGVVEDLEIVPGTWTRMEIEHAGDKIEVRFGKAVLQLTDSTFTEPGMVGLWCKADAVTRFRDWEIEADRRSAQTTEGGERKPFKMPRGFKLIR